MRGFSRSAAGAAALLAVSAPGGAAASTTVIDFEALAAATTAYSVSGVTFTSGPPGGLVTPVGGPNGTRTLVGHLLEDPSDPEYFYFYPLRADFDTLMGTVKVDLGDWPGADQDPDLLFLEIFDAADVSLGRVELPVGPEEPSMRTLSISAPGIKYALFGAAGDGLSSVYADNFTFSTSVPEPSAWALMILGFGGLGAAVRRRRRAAVVSLR